MQKSELNLLSFYPMVPAWTGHSQTLLGHLIPSAALNAVFTQEVVTLSDGDELLLEYKTGTEDITLSIFHGLGGDSQSDYMRRAANIALALGWNVVLVNHRCVSGLARAKRSYHSGRGDDAEAVVNWSRKKFVGSKQVAVGFSMSGSILLNLLTGRYGKLTPDVSIVVNAPLDLGRSADLLAKGFSKIYDVRFFLMLKKLIERNTAVRLPLLGGTRDIDDLYTANANGFIDRHDYYTQCSSLLHLENISSPVFVLTAEDDPFVDFANYQNAKWPDHVHLTYLKHGGHMGYINSYSIENHGHRWLDYYLSRVFKTIT